MRALLALLFALIAAPCFAQSTGGGGGGVTFANPTGSVGLSAVNGSASTPPRSDSSPALSQSIAPTWTGAHTFSPAANATPVTISGYSLTGSNTVPAIDIAGTWNTSSGTTAAVNVNMTVTACGGTCYYQRWQRNGTAECQIAYFVGMACGGFIDIGASPVFYIGASGYQARSANYYAFASSTNATGTLDTLWCRAAAGVIEASATNNACSASGQFLASGLSTHGTIYSAAGTAVPTCNGGAEGLIVSVSDGTSVAFNHTYASGGSVHEHVGCDGTNWKDLGG